MSRKTMPDVAALWIRRRVCLSRRAGRDTA